MSNKISIQDVIAFIRSTTVEDRNLMKQTLREYRDHDDRVKTRSLRINQDVEFEDKHGVTVRGKVTKINLRTIQIRSTTGTRWKVGTPLVRPAGTPKPAEVQADDDDDMIEE